MSARNIIYAIVKSVKEVALKIVFKYFMAARRSTLQKLNRKNIEREKKQTNTL